MGLMSEVKCGRCDRRYSSLKSRCPYCGARRNKHGKHSNDESNSTAKLLIGIVILILLIVAVIVLIFSSIKADSGSKADSNKNNAADAVNPDGVNGGEDIDTIDGTDPNGSNGDSTTDPNGSNGDATTDPNGTNTQDPNGGTTNDPNGADAADADTSEPKVTAVSITFLGADKEDVTMSVGDKVDFDADITPEDADVEVEWSSSDESIFVVLQTGEVTAVGSGTATLTLKVGDKTAECIIRVN